MCLKVLVFCCFCFTFCFAQKKQIVFQDDFDKNLRQWTLESHSFESNLAIFNTQNIKIDSGIIILQLKAAKEAEKPYQGAEIRTKKFFRYGKFTAKLKAPDGSGIVSAFFLYNPHRKENKEIDFEFLGKDNKIATLNHWVNAKSNGVDVSLDKSFSNQYHDYTIEWRKNFIAWSVNGKEIYRTTKAIPKVPLQIVFNIWISKYDSWAGKVNEDALPAALHIAEITCYR